MKKTFFQCCLGILLLTSLCACETDTFVDYNHSYSYKLSGNVTLVPSKYVNATSAELDSMIAAGEEIDTLQCPIKPEQGQLRVVDKGNGESYLAFNDMTGGVTLANTIIDKKHFIFSGKDKEVGIVFNKRSTNNSDLDEILSEPSHINTAYVGYQGEGDEYKQTLIFSLQYEGEVTIKELLKQSKWTIIGSNIECMATQNN